MVRCRRPAFRHVRSDWSRLWRAGWASGEHRLDDRADQVQRAQFAGDALEFSELGGGGAAHVAAECGEREAFTHATAMTHRVDDAAGSAIDGHRFPWRGLEPLDAECEKGRRTLGDHDRWVGDRRAMPTPWDRDVDSGRDVVNQFPKGEG